MTRLLQIRDVITVRFPEQNPLTTDRHQSWVKDAPELYPCLPMGIAGLRSPSIVLLDQVRSIDVERVLKYRGSLTSEQYEPIFLGLQRMLDLGNC